MTEAQNSATTWARMNQAYLNGELQRLRLLLYRRVLWLRRQWKHDPLQNYQMQIVSDAQADWLLAGEDCRAEAAFYQEDAGASEISRSIGKIQEELAEQKRALMEAGRPPAIEMLSHLFGLTTFERDTLLLCLAPELDSAFERLYAYVQDDVSRKYATPHLAMTLLLNSIEDEDRSTARDSFLPEAPLHRFSLVTLEPGTLPATTPSARPLRLDERIADYLRGVNRIDERITNLLQPMPPALLAPSHRDLVDCLEHWLKSWTKSDQRPALNLTGLPGAGKRAVARALCDRLRLALYRLDVRQMPTSGAERGEMLHLLGREAALSQFGLCLDAAQIDGVEELQVTQLFADVTERLSTFFILCSRERWRTEREMVAVQVSKPDSDAQRGLWEQALTRIPHSLDSQVEAIVQQFDFGPQDIAQAVLAARAKARLRASDGDARVTPDDLWGACREQSGWYLDELAQRIIPCYTWEDIVLPEDVFCQLQEIAAQVANRPQVYESWGFGAELSRGRGISALFSGPSGTGKTMAAEILANHLELALYRIDLAGVVSKYIGETEKNLKKVFDAAEQSGAILFFDEADALFGKRTEVRDSHDRYANIEVNYLLQRMEDYRGLAILATNRKAFLDQAFMRRLRFLVDFPFPDAESRRCIWQKVFPSKASVGKLNYDALARLDIPGGNIRNVALNAAFLAADESVPIGMAHIMRAARREYAKIEKLLTVTEFGPYYSKVDA